ncbi:MAG: hypothetical protein COV35_01895 [Alphaproteobacteria bacterium CG11_big_fil_rev_8_21_14_0_20_39_49]|nr:MAG: hypothetical protein COV35_01895 [Alphaproteobacteria bacterium CG11_big_fil_rev_8_21_14_0_20_39_49]
MSATKKDSKNSKLLSLPSVLDIRSASSFYDEIKPLSEAGTNLKVNAKDVEKITTPAIQILLASASTVCKKKGSFKIENPSSEMTNAFLVMGLESQFNKWK